MKPNRYGTIVALAAVLCLSAVTLRGVSPTTLGQTAKTVASIQTEDQVLENLEPEYPPKASFGPSPEKALTSDNSEGDTSEDNSSTEAALPVSEAPAATSSEATVFSTDTISSEGNTDPSGEESAADAAPAADASEPESQVDTSSEAGPSPSEEIPAADATGSQTYVYEDDTIKVTATAPAGALPADVTLQVDEITLPSETDLKEIDKKVAKALTQRYEALMNTLLQQYASEKKAVRTAQAYDIRFITADGQEIDPSEPVQISMQYKDSKQLDEKSDVEMAHIDADDQVESMDADIATDKTGNLTGTEFALAPKK